MAKRVRAIGIRRMRHGWQAYIYVNNRTYTKQFPILTELETMQAWRAQVRADHVDEAPPALARTGTLAHDVTRYLRTRAGMPTYHERAMHLRRWCEALGPHRDRSTVTRLEVEQQLRTWATEYAPQTVRHYRNALRHLYAVLDGPDAVNPARRAWVPSVPAPAVRTLTASQVTRILSEITSPLLHARLSLLWATGLPPALIRQIDPARDLDRRQMRLRVSPRRKGHGTAATWLPIDAAALDACQAMTDVGGWGPAPWRNVRRDFCAAAERAGLSHVRPYDLRHARAALLYAASEGDLATVSRLLLHSSLSTTRRYAAAAASGVDAKVVAKVAEILRAESARADRDRR